MLFMKDAELAARLQHSSNIDELMEAFGELPKPAQAAPRSQLSATSTQASGAHHDDADQMSRTEHVDRHDRLVLKPKAPLSQAA